MEFLSLTRLLWRRRRWTIPASIVAGVLVVLAATSAPPTYRASGTFVLITPAAHPVDPVTRFSPPIANPYVRIGDLSVVVDILQRIMRSAPVTEALRRDGFVGDYQVAANVDFYNGPIVDIAAEGADGETAIANVRLVMAEAGRQLRQLQLGDSVTADELISTRVVVEPTQATTVLSGTLRRVAAVMILGGGLVLAAGIVGEALAKRRRSDDEEDRRGGRDDGDGRRSGNGRSDVDHDHDHRDDHDDHDDPDGSAVAAPARIVRVAPPNGGGRIVYPDLAARAPSRPGATDASNGGELADLVELSARRADHDDGAVRAGQRWSWAPQ